LACGIDTTAFGDGSQPNSYAIPNAAWAGGQSNEAERLQTGDLVIGGGIINNAALWSIDERVDRRND
jgi:hypothetical protein